MLDGVDPSEPAGASPADSDEEEVRRIPTEPLLGGAVRGLSMRSVGLIGDNVAMRVLR